MRRVERQVEIAAPPEQVFAFVSELDNLPRWQSGIQSTEKTSDGPMQPGSSARVVRQLFGQRITADLVVTAYQPPRQLELRSEVSGVRALGSLLVEPSGGGSSVTFAMEISASGFAALMEGTLASAAAEDIADSLRMLRDELEGAGHAA
jgi:carbon monoxide dehydrogenase subunit G